MTSEAQRLHGHLIGQQGSRRSLNTPALVLDLEMLDRNIAEMASFAKAHKVNDIGQPPCVERFQTRFSRPKFRWALDDKLRWRGEFCRLSEENQQQ